MGGSRIWHHLSNGKFIGCMNMGVSRPRILVQRCLVPGLKYGGKIAQIALRVRWFKEVE